MYGAGGRFADGKFQSTPSVGRATFLLSCDLYRKYRISIHALRGEGDENARKTHASYPHFNPRPPWGGRHYTDLHGASADHFNPRPPWGGRQTLNFATSGDDVFQSTPSVGRATLASRALICLSGFQSTPSVGRATNPLDRDQEQDKYFNPRPPWGGRQCRQCDNRDKDRISIHALRGEGDLNTWKLELNPNISIHALRGEGDDCSRV